MESVAPAMLHARDRDMGASYAGFPPVAIPDLENIGNGVGRRILSAIPGETDVRGLLFSQKSAEKVRAIASSLLGMMLGARGRYRAIASSRLSACAELPMFEGLPERSAQPYGA
jgi:hypothetical protein